MTGFTLTITLDDAQLRGDMRDLIGRLDRPAPFYRRSATFSWPRPGELPRRTCSDGTPWTPLRPATIKARQRRGRSGLAILRESGLLKGSLGYEVAAEGVRVGATAPYAAIHQFGGTIKKAARQGKVYRHQFADGTFGRRFAKKKLKTTVGTDVGIRAHSITIPARPYLGVGAQDIDDIRRLADRWLAGQL